MKNKKSIIIISIVVSAILVIGIVVGVIIGVSNKGNGTTEKSLAVCIASEPDSIDPALNSAVDGATLIIHNFAGLVKYDANKNLVADLATALPTPTVADNGEATYVFKLRDGLKWSDGSALKASDLEYSWKRAASTALGADYGYMFDIIKGYGEDDVDGLAPLDVTADDDNNTFTVVTTVRVPYFFELCAFPTFMPVKKDVVASESWATAPSTYIGNGPYKMTKWEHNTLIVLEKNENYHDAASVTMDKLEFYLSDDASSMLANFKTGTWTMIDDVPQDEIANLKNDPAFHVEGQIGTYYVVFNNNRDLLPATFTGTAAERQKANQEVRKALGLLLDRNHICNEIGQAGQVPASSFVAMGLTDADGSEFYKNAGHGEGYIGYYNTAESATATNAVEAVTTLKKYYNYDENTKKFTDFPNAVYLYNTSEGHKAIGEYIQSAFAAYGIPMTLTNQEWNTFLQTRKQGDYTIARNGWLADYNDPISFLDMWISDSGNNDAQLGKISEAASGYDFDGSNLAIYSMDLSGIAGYADKSVENGTWADTYDTLIGYIKNETDSAKRMALMHVAEDVLMETGTICPIYYYTDIYMISTDVKGFFSSPLGYKYFMYTTVA